MNVAILSDTHCGHLYGLTPTNPDWRRDGGEISKVQDIVWRWYVDKIMLRRPIDVLICNGDMIDGQGKKSGGTELITSDRREQCKMAAQVIEQSGARKVVLIHGTAYHDGDGEDFEDILGDMIHAEVVGGHEQLRIGGVLFDVKHHIGTTSAPYTQYTGMAREAVTAALWAEKVEGEMPDVLIRSHRHKFDYCGDGRRLNIVTPGLQWHTKYGGRRCSGLIDIGFIWFECQEGKYTWGTELLELKGLVSKPLEL